MKKPIKILIIGNGFGGVYALKNLHKIFHKDKGVELALVGDKNYFLFTPLLHEVATGGINGENIIQPIHKILGCCLKNFYLGKAKFIDTKNKIVKVGDISVSYDYLVLAPGAETNFFNTPGAEEFSFTLKSIEDAMKIKNHCINQMERASHEKDRVVRKKILRFVVVGGGPTGVELVAELEELVEETFSHYYSKEIMEDVSILLIQKAPVLVPQFGKKIQQKSLEVLRKKGVEVMLNTAVKEIGDSYIIKNENEKIETETVIWTAGIKPAKLEFDIPISQSPDGKLIVNEYLQLDGYKEIFALGDAVFLKQEDTALPALAQVAEKESVAVAKNIKLLMDAKPLEKFIYHSSGNLLSLGRWMAAGEMFSFTFSGQITWWIWRTVYLSKLISWRKKVSVAIDWTMNLFSPRDISQL